MLSFMKLNARFTFVLAICCLTFMTSAVDAQVLGDVNGNGVRDIQDLNAICNGVGQPCRIGIPGVYDPRDLNQDYCIDGDDVFEFRLIYGVLDLGGIQAVLFGDANLDGYVDFQDLNICQQNLFQSGTSWGTCDFDCNNVTDGFDYLILTIFLGQDIF